MRYQKARSQSYGAQKPKVFVPKGLKGKDKQFYKATAIKPVGDWSRDLLQSTEAGKILAVMHFENVRKALEKSKPKTKGELKRALKKAVMTPQQRFIILYEKSLLMPLSTNEFHEYMELFRENFPEAYKSLYGKNTPAQIVAECIRHQKRK